MYPVPCVCCIPTPPPSFPARKGLPPLRTQGSPLRSDPFLRYRSGMDKPLTSFTPLFKSNYRAFSESPLNLIFFCLIPRYPRDGVPGRSSLCFFCLAGARFLRAGGADSVKPCPTIGGHPKGLVLEGIRGASYALDVPAKQNRLRSAPPAFLILSITRRRA